MKYLGSLIFFFSIYSYSLNAQDCLNVQEVLQGKWRLDSVLGLGGFNTFFKEQTYFSHIPISGLEFSNKWVKKYEIRLDGDTIYSDSSYFVIHKQTEYEGGNHILRFIHPESLDTGQEKFYIHVDNENKMGISYSYYDSLNLVRSYLQTNHEYSKLYPDTTLEKRHFSGTWYMNRPFCDLAIGDTLILDRSKKLDKLKHQDFPCIKGDLTFDYFCSEIFFNHIEYTFTNCMAGFPIDGDDFLNWGDSPARKEKKKDKKDNVIFSVIPIGTSPWSYCLDQNERTISFLLNDTDRIFLRYSIQESIILLVRVK